MRGFLGLHKFVPNPALRGDMGWNSTNLKRKLCLLRLYNRIISMDDQRLPKIVLNWDMKTCTPGWARDVSNIVNEIGLYSSFINKIPICIENAKHELEKIEITQWEENVNNMDKLRTYANFKWSFGVEKYVKTLLSKSHRSFLAQFRCGILPIRIETGRFQGLHIRDRLCEVCNQCCIEDEIHFLLECPTYECERNTLFIKANFYYENFNELEDDVKLCIFMNDEDLFGSVAKYIDSAYHKRSEVLTK